MSNIWFISDLHFGHRNMAIRRGFYSTEEHDSFIVDRINCTIKKRDTLWILGDITMEKDNYEILDSIKGIKKVCLGNHDKLAHVPSLLKHVNHVFGIHKYKKYWLSHCPIHPLELHGLPNIHGHVHEKSIANFDKYDIQYVNVSCEAIQYTPISLEEINQKLEIRNGRS